VNKFLFLANRYANKANRKPHSEKEELQARVELILCQWEILTRLQASSSSSSS